MFDVSIYGSKQPLRLTREQLQALKDNCANALASEDPVPRRLQVIIKGEPGSGRTTLQVLLAQGLRRLGHGVILLDSAIPKMSEHGERFFISQLDEAIASFDPTQLERMEIVIDTADVE